MKKLKNCKVLILDDYANRPTRLANIALSLGISPVVCDKVSTFLRELSLDVCACFIAHDVSIPAMAEKEGIGGVNIFKIKKKIAEVGKDIRIVFYTNTDYLCSPTSEAAQGIDDYIRLPDREYKVRKNLLIAAYGLDDENNSTDSDYPMKSHYRVRYYLDGKNWITSRLTKRQAQVMSLLSEGLSNEQIASLLGLSVRTVQIHRRDAIVKLGARTTNEAIKVHTEITARETMLFR